LRLVMALMAVGYLVWRIKRQDFGEETAEKKKD
jgi:hypothetical protein